jgi:hypothetical protein
MKNDYVAWLDGTSVARGSLADVRAKAKAIFESDRWQEHGARDGRSVLKITRGARQYFVEAQTLHHSEAFNRPF